MFPLSLPSCIPSLMLSSSLLFLPRNIYYHFHFFCLLVVWCGGVQYIIWHYISNIHFYIYVYIIKINIIVIIIYIHIIMPVSASCSTWTWTPPGTSSFWAFPRSVAWSYRRGSTPTLVSSTQVRVLYLKGLKSCSLSVDTDWGPKPPTASEHLSRRWGFSLCRIKKINRSILKEELTNALNAFVPFCRSLSASSHFPLLKWVVCPSYCVQRIFGLILKNGKLKINRGSRLIRICYICLGMLR